MTIGIAMLASVYAPSIGGIQTHTRHLSRALSARGARVLLVTRHHHGLPREEQTEGFSVLRVGRGDASRAVATGSYIASALKALQARRQSIDLVHAHQLLSPTTIALASRPLLGKPLIANPHACGPIGDVAQLASAQGPLGRLRLSATRRFVDAFISISQIIRGELLSAGVPEHRIWDIPNGVDTQVYRPADIDERRALRRQLSLPPGPLVIAAGRLAREKGVDVLLDAWPHVLSAAPNATLLLLGDGDERVALEKQARALRIERSVIFRGRVADTAPFLRASDVFALPSRTEGLPVALLEAMACGLPLCATAAGGTPEVLSAPRLGQLVPSEQPERLGEAIADLLRRRDVACTESGEAARAHVVAHYSIDAVADRTLQLYERLVRAHRSAPSLRAEPC